eukprot:TRINITY_DN3074_c0_g3_i1.p1 TRINITY_DN3074_c0_g3~~TRINITY_DN3074_c0_g3_i1.p1  ORF type:complete len:323 (+),score=65.87 TRINITY_DN3074_c0_g3_i1:137-970(+)
MDRTWNACLLYVKLVETLPAEIFVDPFEVRRLKRASEEVAVKFGPVNLEAPSFLASPITLTVEVDVALRVYASDSPIGERPASSPLASPKEEILPPTWPPALPPYFEVEVRLPLHARYPLPVARDSSSNRVWGAFCSVPHAEAQLGLPLVFMAEVGASGMSNCNTCSLRASSSSGSSSGGSSSGSTSSGMRTGIGQDVGDTEGGEKSGKGGRELLRRWLKANLAHEAEVVGSSLTWPLPTGCVAHLAHVEWTMTAAGLAGAAALIAAVACFKTPGIS